MPKPLGHSAGPSRRNRADRTPEGVPERTIFHCFTGGPAEAEAWLDELRPERPLRHRLGVELDELRELSSQG